MGQKRLLCIVAGALAVTSFLAAAEPLYFLNRTIVSRIPAKDIPSLKTAVGGVLNDSPDGTRTQWQSSPGNGTAAVTMVIQPLQSTQSQKLGACRLLLAQVSQPPSTESWQFWFCKQEGGGWKASGSLE